MGVKPEVGTEVALPPGVELVIMDTREVDGGSHEYLCEWWVLGTKFQCWIPETELEAGGSGEEPGSVGRA